MASLRLSIEAGRFHDSQGRQIVLRGINVAGDAKFPSDPDQPSHVSKNFFDGDSVRFHARPFTQDDAPVHFARLRSYGFNSLRYVFTWEAVEAAGPGRYDETWISHTIEVLRVAKSYGFYIILDPHQDVWSRFCGGSGAPMWTIYACGLDPQRFAATEAAMVHNTYPDPEEFSMMLWATNYYRLAAATIFTLFWAGRDFAPKCIIDDVNIQDYLQGHFIRMCEHVARRVHEAGDLEDSAVIGWESINEPNHALLGVPDLLLIPEAQILRKGSSPTPWQAILTGSGRACEVETWEIGSLGPYRVGRKLVDPHGVSTWLSPDYDDSRYGYKRDPGWRLGECIWALHGVWDPSTDRLLRPDYFHRVPTGSGGSGPVIDHDVFMNVYYLRHFRTWKDAVRGQHRNAILLMQGPVLQLPPNLESPTAKHEGGDSDVDEFDRVSFAPHWYDGLTLMRKHFNRRWNVDLVGLIRKRYWHTALAIKVGETAIRNCFRDQMIMLRGEVSERMGNRPCVMTEFGIPFDLDGRQAYSTGDYSAQLAAMDAIFNAAERSNLEGYFLWVYVATNCHAYGDMWNGEHLSIFSLDDKILPLAGISSTVVSRQPSLESFSSPSLSGLSTRKPGPAQSGENAGLWQASHLAGDPATSPGASAETQSNVSTDATALQRAKSEAPSTAMIGTRAVQAVIRPVPTAVRGRITSYGFTLRTCTFDLTLDAPPPSPPTTPPGQPTTQVGDDAGSEDTLAGVAPTVIFLPEFHFPLDECKVEATDGRWEIRTLTAGGPQYLSWWHPGGDQRIQIVGLARRHPVAPGEMEEEIGYLEQCLNVGGFGSRAASLNGKTCQVM